jgi:hypothetical protein
MTWLAFLIVATELQIFFSLLDWPAFLVEWLVADFSSMGCRHVVRKKFIVLHVHGIMISSNHIDGLLRSLRAFNLSDDIRVAQVFDEAVDEAPLACLLLVFLR